MLDKFDYDAAELPVTENQLSGLRKLISESGFPDSELDSEHEAFLRESNGGGFELLAESFRKCINGNFKDV